MKQYAVSKGKGKASKVAKTSSVVSTSGTRSQGSDVEDSSDESEHEENCSNPDIDVPSLTCLLIGHKIRVDFH